MLLLKIVRFGAHLPAVVGCFGLFICVTYLLDGCNNTHSKIKAKTVFSKDLDRPAHEAFTGGPLEELYQMLSWG